MQKKRNEKRRAELAAVEAYNNSAAGQAQTELRARQLREATRNDTKGRRGVEAALLADLERVEEETPRAKARRSAKEIDVLDF